MENDIVFENVWTSPEPNVYFTESCTLSVQLRNVSAVAVRIEKIKCEFQHDDGIEFTDPEVRPGLVLAPEELSSPPIRLTFGVDLSMRSGTNTYKLKTYYRRGNSRRAVEFAAGKAVLIQPPCPPQKQLFISHSDPGDTQKGKWLVEFLRKVGFRGYLSEENPTPGFDIWIEKIPSEVKRSLATIVLWTRNAREQPQKIIKEVNIALSKKKRVIVITEKNLRSPKGINRNIEYVRSRGTLTKSDLLRLAVKIAEMHQSGELYRMVRKQKRK